MKPLLSIVIPAVPGRINRLKCIVSRLTLNASRHPDVPFETIIVDGSEHGEYRELTDFVSKFMTIKYVCLPIGKFINAGYPRNVGFRLAEGAILTQVDIDWFIGEDFIEGAVEPYIRKNIAVLNNGYMIDTSTAKKVDSYGPQYIEALGEFLLDQSRAMNKEIGSIFKAAEIPAPEVPKSIWLWAAPREAFFAICGYDEKYCQKWAYTREDCDLFWRLVAVGLPKYGESFEKFCGLHIWHPAAQRSGESNQLNKDYYNKMNKDDKGNIVIRDKIRNVGHSWGKMLKYGYTIIEGKVRNPEETENWINDNQQNVRSYFNSSWDSVDIFVEACGK